MKLTKLFGTLLIVIAFAGNAIAKDINSDADWASVTTTDEVVIKCNTSLPRDITCKSLTLNTQGTCLNFANHKITVLGDVSINGYEAKITNGNLDVSGKIEIVSQNSSISGTLVKVGGDVTVNGYDAKINSILECGGNLSMSNQNTYISGPINVGGNIIISGYSAGVGGNVVCQGDFTMSSQNSYIQGDVSVKGDINMTGNSSSISGSATAGGSINTSNNSNISGSQSQNDPNGGSATSGETPSGEEPSGEEPTGGDSSGGYSLEFKKNGEDTYVSENCYGKFIVKPYGGYSIFFILDESNNRIRWSDYSSYNFVIEGFSVSNEWYDNVEYAVLKTSQNGSSTKTFYVQVKGKTIKRTEEIPNCGLDVPSIYGNKTSICLQDIKDGNLSTPSVSGAKTQTWKVNDSSVDNLTNVKVGDIITYCVTDNNNVESCSPNSVTVQDIPYISPIGDISYCAADGGYDLSKHVVTDNGATTNTIWKLNEEEISNSSSPILNAGDKLYVEATNTCGTTSATMNVSNGCIPKIETIGNFDAICNGETLSLPVPEINYYEEDEGDYQWQILNGEEWEPFEETYNFDYDYDNGKKLRVVAYNTLMIPSYSNELVVTVKPNTPEFTVSSTGSSVTESFGGSSSSVTYTVNKTNDCNNDDITFDISDNTHFTYTENGNQITVSLKEGLDVDTYHTKILFDVGTEHEEVILNGSVVEWPKTYILKKYSKRTPTKEDPLPYDISTEELVYIETDANGNINYELTSGDNHIYVNFDDIKCTNFTLTTSATDHCNSQFINKGKIIASENISLGTSNKKIGGTGYIFDCEGAYIANNFYTYNNNETPAIKGIFLITNNFNIAEAQGQNFKIDECADVKAKNANINFSGGTMQLIVDGHIVAEKMIVNNMVIVKDNGILTVGDTEIAGGINFVGGPNSLINLCKNPTINGRDNLGGTCGTILYNYGEGGWKDTDPEKEEDVNYYANSNDKSQAISALNAAGIYNITDIKASEKVAMYSSYNDCIAEKGLPSFLGIEDDPFLPKDKEIRSLYNCNPCSKDFENTKIELREIHGRTFRLINGELIYCENDN